MEISARLSGGGAFTLLERDNKSPRRLTRPASRNPGFAMKVTDKVAAIGAIIGKALDNLDSGTGTIPVLVMPK